MGDLCNDNRFELIEKYKLPSVQEQKKGYWIFEEYPDGYYHSECSVCGHWFDEDAYLKQYEICPNCLANMKGKQND